MTLALCMIVKNEEDVLARCLDSAAGIFDELVLVDTGSEDATKEIAARYGARVYDFAWRDDFAAARNFAFSKAGADYLMWLDADDVLKEEARAALLRLKAELDGSVDAYFLRYEAEDGEGNTALTFWRERIVQRACGFVWQGAVHETLCVCGTVRRLDIAVTHRRGERKETGRNLRIYLRMLLAGRTPRGREAFYFARELCDNGLCAPAADAYAFFLQGEGWAEDKICACRDLAAIFRKAGDPERRRAALLQSFRYGEPRPAVCCDLGELFLEEGDAQTAVFWFKLALNEGERERDEGFVCPDHSGYLPCIWLCVCYDRLGQPERARCWNERAGRYKPHDKSYLYNKKYFESVFTDKGKKT